MNMSLKKQGFFDENRYKKSEDFNLALNGALKAGGTFQDEVFGYLSFKIKPAITKYCHQYRVEDVKNVLQETLLEMFVQIGNGKYPPEGKMAYSPVAFATKIGHFKTLEASPLTRPPKILVASNSEEKLQRMANELDADKEAAELQLYWKEVDKLVHHLNANMKGLCHELIWKRIAEQRSYKEIHPDYPQYKEPESLRNQVSKCLKRWRELLEQNDLIKKKKQ